MSNISNSDVRKKAAEAIICSDCPRHCHARRTADSGEGFCRCGTQPYLVRAAPHYGEEPCISGEKGSGAIFFSGCNLRCIYCQNHTISRSPVGRKTDAAALRRIMLSLRDQGVHNINLVTPTHHTLLIAEVLSGIELGIPVVWNSSGYDSPEMLRQLEGLVQIYMPDYKYASSDLARKYSSAEDYPFVAAAAIREMFRQRGAYRTDENGILQSGVLIRHLILPGSPSNSMDVIDFVADTFPQDSVLFSLMSQYTPVMQWKAFPELNRRVSEEENELLLHYLHTRKITSGFWQEPSSSTEEMIPAFDGTGV